jgi:hypothetical protein
MTVAHIPRVVNRVGVVLKVEIDVWFMVGRELRKFFGANTNSQLRSVPLVKLELLL